ncbi:RNA polymerase sigma factor [Pseudobythopirellula maris]|uniref:RNA polymerase sigma factor n=1 Tax=Pseudobythopirellula maris TaxID=2527991 RepID=A0A5C5ZJS9_9BACT|nr:sigma-70 family RNA polymerase sigma factor [Pseudobythopirellula maris]TWT87664.1 RNA polymerase sigma factor [Pseudobythopirellula maris]
MEDDSDPSDALIERVRQRDPAALADYLDAVRRRMIGFIKSLCSDRLLSVVELDDLYQEVSATALTGLATAPLDEYAPIDWLQQIARRRVIDAHRFHFEAQRRDAGRQQSMHAQADSSVGGMEALLVASITSPSAAFSRDVRMDRMQQAMGELTEEQQTAIRLRYAEGLPTKEIAERLGKTDVAVRVLLSRSMRQLEKQLEDVRPSER